MRVQLTGDRSLKDAPTYTYPADKVWRVKAFKPEAEDEKKREEEDKKTETQQGGQEKSRAEQRDERKEHWNNPEEKERGPEEKEREQEKEKEQEEVSLSLSQQLLDPSRTVRVRMSMRDAFVAAPGCVLLSADYNQIELRLMAHLSGDPSLLRIFRGKLLLSTAVNVFFMSHSESVRHISMCRHCYPCVSSPLATRREVRLLGNRHCVD